MADDVLIRRLQEGLKCAICRDTFKDPKLLQCFHIFCQRCLGPLVARDQQGQLGLTCPTCRVVTPIPERGVAGLQPAIHLNPLLEVRSELGDQVPAVEGSTRRASIADAPSRNVTNRCHDHPKGELQLYCSTCEKLVCYQCVIRTGRHEDHDYKEVEIAYREYREKMSSYLEPMQIQVVKMKKALAEIDSCHGEITVQQATIKDKIHVPFRHLQEALAARETKLINELDQLTQGKLQKLATQKGQIETTLARVISSIDFARESLRTGSETSPG